MNRYINAETIKVSITRYGECVVKHKHLNFIKEMVKEIISDVCFAIDAQPTVDAVKVVRCKDCKHKYPYNNVWMCRFGLMIPSPDGFCSYGEKVSE